MGQPHQDMLRNLLLRQLSVPDYALLAPHLEYVELKKRERIILRGEPIDFVHFPESSVASVIASSPENERVEAGLFGREGFSGVPLILGAARADFEVLIQIEDGCHRVAVAPFLEAVAACPEMRGVFLRYAYVSWLQTGYTALSNALHSIEERLARWLLMCHDRLDTDEMDLTHEFMALMLAVRRPSVTTALHVLEGNRFVFAKRGRVIMRDRQGLEDFASESYGQPEAEYQRLLGPMGNRQPLLDGRSLGAGLPA